MTVSTKREFRAIFQKAITVEINLDARVEYQVKDPRRVAIEISAPLTSLFDHVIQALHRSIVHATIDEIFLKVKALLKTPCRDCRLWIYQKYLGLKFIKCWLQALRLTTQIIIYFARFRVNGTLQEENNRIDLKWQWLKIPTATQKLWRVNHTKQNLLIKPC